MYLNRIIFRIINFLLRQKSIRPLFPYSKRSITPDYSFNDSLIGLYGKQKNQIFYGKGNFPTFAITCQKLIHNSIHDIVFWKFYLEFKLRVHRNGSEGPVRDIKVPKKSEVIGTGWIIEYSLRNAFAALRFC